MIREPMLPATKNAIPTPGMRRLRYCVASYCFAICLAMLTLPASANCFITRLTASDAVIQVLKENGGYKFQNYDVICNKLRKANAQVVIDGTYGVLSNRSFGWASIGVADMDRDYIIILASGRNHTRMHDYASDDTARKLLWISINDALDGWDTLDQALAELDKARQAVRKTAAQR